MITLVIDSDTPRGRHEAVFSSLDDGVMAWERATTRRSTYSATLWIGPKMWRDFDRGEEQ
jgi:hypothetical protein